MIEPLFLVDLNAELRQIKSLQPEKLRRKNLLDFQDKLSKLKFFDPACGSGNFLTESFICLRRLENDILRELFGAQIQLGAFNNPIKVSIQQFFGIEINDFACTVARTALWIAELQMIQETQEIIHRDLNFLPLKSYANIIEGNALRLDWKNILPPDVNFIMGNPPFVGYSFQSQEQKADILNVYKSENGKPYKKAGKIDYVAAWYFKAAEFSQSKKIRCAFVSTNSITQGEQVANVWKILVERFNLHIDFAYRTFKWSSESANMAAVHCVIIGFSTSPSTKQKIIFDGEEKIVVQNINFYLQDSATVFIESRTKPICNVPEMIYGNKPTEGGNLIIEANDYADFIKKEPAAKKFIRPLIGADEFINGKKRYCLWLVDAAPNEIKKMPLVYQRVKNVRDFRLKSAKAQMHEDANRPTEFQEIRQSATSYILVPRVSSENRRYIPMGFLPPNVIASDAVQIIPDATIYHFGILTSSIHMAWMRAVAGRLKSDYRYSATIVYNNFVWCDPTAEQRRTIEKTAQNILDVRAQYPDATLADLYNDILMPKNLRDAHKENDSAVMAAYKFSADFTESDIVIEVFKLYERRQL